MSEVTQPITSQGVETPASFRLVILSDLLKGDSARVVSEKWGVPQETIYNWADNLGGVRHLRELYDTQIMSYGASIGRNVANRFAKELADLDQESVVALALKLLDITGKAMIPNGKDAGVTINQNPQTVNINHNQTPEDETDQVYEIVAALAESGALDSALELYLAKKNAVEGEVIQKVDE